MFISQADPCIVDIRRGKKETTTKALVYVIRNDGYCWVHVAMPSDSVEVTMPEDAYEWDDGSIIDDAISMLASGKYEECVSEGLRESLAYSDSKYDRLFDGGSHD